MKVKFKFNCKLKFNEEVRPWGAVKSVHPPRWQGVLRHKDVELIVIKL